MKRRHRWLVPSIAIVATLIVSAVAASVGIRFAAPEPSPSLLAGETTVVPVLEPVDPTVVGADLDPFDVSPAIGEIEVPITPSTPGIAESSTGDDAVDTTDVDRVLESMGSADDPVALWDGGVPSAAPRVSALGDPCAEPEPSSDEGCPEGLRGTILSLTAPPPFYVLGVASPPTRADISGVALTHCPAVSLSAREVSFAVGTNAPATITLRYWPVTDPTDVRERVLMTDPEQRAAWDAGFALAEPDLLADWFRPQHCTVLDGVRDFTPYRAELFAVDQFGREASRTVDFTSAAVRSAPPVRVLPVGDRDVFISAPHTAEHIVQIAVYQIPSGVPVERRTCNGLPEGGVASEVRGAPRTTPTDPAYTERNGFLPQYDRRTTARATLSYGAVALLCIRWFDIDRASFDTDRPVREYEQFVSTPDPLQPIISIDRLDLVRTVADDGLQLSGRDLSGGSCGSWVGPAEGESFADGDDLEPGVRPTAIVCEPGTTANVVVITSQVRAVEGAPSTPFAITVPPSPCAGVLCVAPEPVFYRVALADVEVAAGLCGSSFGSCDPPTRTTSVGSVLLRVDWVGGTGNGNSDWIFEAPDDGPPEQERPATPQLDTTQEVGILAGGRAFTASLEFDLVTDRPVDYTVRLLGDCLPAWLETEQTGRSEGRRVITFDDVCVGARYAVEVQLVADDGTTSTWSAAEVEHQWSLGVIDVPGESARVTVSLDAVREDLSFVNWAHPVTLQVAGRTLPLAGLDRCVDERGLRLDEFVVDDVELATLSTVTVTIGISTVFGGSDGRTLRCGEIDELGPTFVLSAVDVPIAELLARDGIVLTAPDGETYDVRLALRAIRSAAP